MLMDLFRWWAGQMRDLVPASRRGGIASGEALVIQPLDAVPAGFTAVALRRRRGGHETVLGQFSLNPVGLAALRRAAMRQHGTRVVVLCTAEPILERTVTLPLATESMLTDVLPHEMDRLTPFNVTEVFWHGAVAGRDRARSRLQVRLLLAPAAMLRTLLPILAGVGLNPTRLEQVDDSSRFIPLPRMQGAWQRRGAVAGAVALACLVAFAVALPFLSQARALAAADARIAALQPRMQHVEELRRRLAGNSSGSDVLAAERARVGDALSVLATVTDALPDGTFLTSLSLMQRHLALEGQSAAAARLIPALAAYPMLRNPVFAAPVTRNEGSGTAVAHPDLFSIRAEVAP